MPFVLTALRAERLRAAVPRRRAELRACSASDLFDAAPRPSRFKAALVARERVREGLRRTRPRRSSRFAWFLVRADVVPFLGD
jgi:hypothetical protein